MQLRSDTLTSTCEFGSSSSQTTSNLYKLANGHLNDHLRGWRDVSGAKGIHCSWRMVPSSSSWLTASPVQDLQVPFLVYMYQIVGTMQGFLSIMWVMVLTLLTEAITVWAFWLICSFFLSLSSCFPFCPLRSLENILSLFLKVHFRKLLSSEITSKCGSFNLSFMLTFKHRLLSLPLFMHFHLQPCSHV